MAPDSRLVLIIAWKFRAETQCEFTREEFFRGFQEFGVDNLDKMKEKLQIIDNDLKDPMKFKDFYQFAFNYAKDPGKVFLKISLKKKRVSKFNVEIVNFRSKRTGFRDGNCILENLDAGTI